MSNQKERTSVEKREGEKGGRKNGNKKKEREW